MMYFQPYLEETRYNIIGTIRRGRTDNVYSLFVKKIYLVYIRCLSNFLFKKYLQIF